MKTGYSFGSLASFVETINNTTVKLTGNQTIAGIKTFSSNPISSAAQGTGGSHLTRKDYVDGALALKAPLASPVFTGDARAQTVAQFDNDTSLATTAFVQRALGNRQTFAWVDGGGTIQPTVAGAMVMLGNSGTYYLPNVTSVAVGATFHCFVQGGGYIAAQSGQTIQFNVNVAGSGSLPIQTGDSFTVTRVNDNWFITGTIYTPTIATSDNSTRPATTAFVRNVLNSSPTLAGHLTVSGNTYLNGDVYGIKTFNLDGAAIRDGWNNTVVGNRASGGAYAATFERIAQTELFLPAMHVGASTQNVGYTTAAKFGMYSTGLGGWDQKQAGIWIGSSENDTHPHYLFKFSAYGDINCAYVWAIDLHASRDITASGALNVSGNSTLNGTVYCNQIAVNSYITVPTTERGSNNTNVANTAWVQRELQHQMSSVSYAQSNENRRWFKIGWLPASESGTLDSFMAQGSFGSWTGTKVPFTMTATNREGLKVTCTSQVQLPFYFYQLPGGDVDIFIRLAPYHILQGQTWIAPGDQGTAWRMGEVPCDNPIGTQIYTTDGNTKIYAYTDSPSFTGTVTCAGAFNVGGTLTTSGFICTSGTDFRAGITVSGGDMNVANGKVLCNNISSRSQQTFRQVFGKYGMFWHADDDNHYLMITNADDQYGAYSSLRPFYVSNSTGLVTCENGISTPTLGVGGGVSCGSLEVSKTARVHGEVYCDSSIAVTNNVIASGELRSTRAEAPGIRLTGGNYGTLFYNDGGENFYIMCTNANDQLGGFNNLRPFHLNKRTGLVTMANGTRMDGGFTGSGTCTVPTVSQGTNDTQVATTAFVTAAIVAVRSDAAPLMNGTAAIGVSTRFARQDHRHPIDTSRAPLASPSFTGTVTCAGALSIGGTTTTNGLIVTSGTDFRAGLTVSGGAGFFQGTLSAMGEISNQSANAFRMVQGNYGAFWRNDGTNLYLMFTNSGDAWGQWNSLRPLSFDLSNGYATFGHGVGCDNLTVQTSTILRDLTVNTTLHTKGQATFEVDVWAGNGIVTGGEFRSPRADTPAFRMTGGTYGTLFYNDGGENFYIMCTNANDQLGGFNNLRPFILNKRTGLVQMSNGLSVGAGLWTDQAHISSATNSAPTQTAGTNNTTIATTAFVNTAVAGKVAAVKVASGTCDIVLAASKTSVIDTGYNMPDATVFNAKKYFIVLKTGVVETDPGNVNTVWWQLEGEPYCRRYWGYSRMYIDVTIKSYQVKTGSVTTWELWTYQ